MMLNWIISSSVLILAVILLRFALRGRMSPVASYLLWGLVLLRLLVPVSVMHVPYSAASLVENTQLSQDLERLEYVDAVEHADDGSVLGIMHDAVFNTEVGGWADTHTIVDYSADEEEFSRWQRSSNVKNFGENILRPAWIAGIVLVAAWFIAVNAVFTQRLRRTRQKLDCDCPRPVYISDAVETPCLHGLFAPTIYVTPAVAADETALRHVLAHELSHYRHGDQVWGIFRAAVLALHWYNPLVWYAAALSRRDAELCCDESAIEALGEEQRTDYGRTLIALSCRNARPNDLILTATTMTGGKRTLKERIVLIVKKPQTKAAAVFLVAVIAIFAAVFSFAGSVPGSSYIRTSSAGPTNEDFRLRYDKTITHVRLVCDIYQDGELLKVEDRVFPTSAVEHIHVEPRLKGLDSRDYDIVVTIDGSMSKQEIVFDVTTGYTYEQYGWSTPNMPEPVKLAVDDNVMLMILRAGDSSLSIIGGDELPVEMLRFLPDRTAVIRLEFYGNEKSARDQGSGNAYENPLVIAADNLRRYGRTVFTVCENEWVSRDDNSLYTCYRFGNLQQATLSVKYYQKGQLMQEAKLPYDLRLSRYLCDLTPTAEGWKADATAYDYALTRPTDSINITVPVSGTPQVQNRYGSDIGDSWDWESSLKVGQTYCLATAVWGDSVLRWGGEYEDTPALIAEAEHLVLYELTVEAHGGDLYEEYMSGTRSLYIHLPPELTTWELPSEDGKTVITGAVVPVGNQGYELTENEYLEMTENGTDATTILSNRRYWAMEYADYIPEWLQP